jgi:hypothetical protein
MTATPTPTPTLPPCAGDCRGDGQVTVDEILTLVEIALGELPTSACASGDGNHDGQITVDEILVAVNHALNGCVVTPTPTGLFAGNRAVPGDSRGMESSG